MASPTSIWPLADNSPQARIHSSLAESVEEKVYEDDPDGETVSDHFKLESRQRTMLRTWCEDGGEDGIFRS